MIETAKAHLRTSSKLVGAIVERARAEAALVASNEQLAASNQQLRAAEQHLRASNQQLRAVEQQLRASNQQLGASNQQLRAAQEELVTRNRITEIFLTASDEEMYHKVLKVLLEATESRYGVFGYVDEEGALVVPSMTRHIWDECDVQTKDIVFPREEWGDSSWPRAIREKRANYTNEPSCNVPSGHIAIRRHMTMPLIHRGQVVGLLQVANKERDYTEADFELLDVIGRTVGPVLDARLRKERHEKAISEAMERQALHERVLAALNRANESGVLLSDLLREIKRFTGFDAVDIRLRQGEVLPPRGMYGTGEGLVEQDSGISLPEGDGRILDGSSASAFLADLSGRVINGDIDTSRPFFTEAGSFWSNHLTQMMQEATGWAPQQGNPSVSNAEGYESVALIPLRSGDETIGLLQLKDCNTERFKDEEVRFFEQIGESIGVAYRRWKLEEARRSSDEQLRQSQRLEAIGKLAGGIAHDFNNLLTVILGYGGNLLEVLHADDPLRRDAKEIVAAGERASTLTRQLLAFSRKQALQPQIVNINKVVENLKTMLQRLIGEDIQFCTVLAEDLGVTGVDPGQLEQVIMNLAVNARDAMPQGGRLTIETMNTELDPEYARDHVSVAPGQYVMLAVTDTGFGMDKETKERVFEPFFSTKEKEKGTGLGLSTVYGIVKQSGGNIWVYSEPEMGTTFKVYLPRAEAQGARDTLGETEGVPSGDGKHVLVVEDEAALRRLIERMVESLGYHVTAAANGGEALLIVEEKGLRPDLIITDVVMPGMSGRLLVDRLRRTQADVKALYMSGYTDNAIVHHGVLDAETPFIQKPFNRSELASKIAWVMRGETPRG